MRRPAVGDLNGDGTDNIIFDAQSSNPPEKNPINILLRDGAGGYIDGTSTIVGGPIPPISTTHRFLIRDFNGSGQLEVYMDNHGVEDECCTPGEEDRLLLLEVGGGLVQLRLVRNPENGVLRLEPEDPFSFLYWRRSRGGGCRVQLVTRFPPALTPRRVARRSS